MSSRRVMLYADHSAVQYELGCQNNQLCSSTGAATIIGRSVDKRQQQSCHECCSTTGCNEQLCSHRKLDGNWAEWTQWSNCIVTCGNGTQIRTRTCTSPTPQHGGLDCQGENNQTLVCVKPLCPVHGGWSQWSLWGQCSVTCDVGMEARTRTCTNPKPDRFGDHCFGVPIENRICNLMTECISKGIVAFNAKGKNILANGTAVFGTVIENEGHGYNETTGQFVAPFAGVYSFSAQLCGHTNSPVFFRIRKSGASGENVVEIGAGYFHVNSYSHLCARANAFTYLHTNDKVWVYSAGTTSYLYHDSNVWCSFTGARV